MFNQSSRVLMSFHNVCFKDTRLKSVSIFHQITFLQSFWVYVSLDHIILRDFTDGTIKLLK